MRGHVKKRREEEKKRRKEERRRKNIKKKSVPLFIESWMVKKNIYIIRGEERRERRGEVTENKKKNKKIIQVEHAPYKLSWRTKEGMFLCLKNLGITVCEKT